MIKDSLSKIKMGPFVRIDKKNKGQNSSRVLNKSTEIPNTHNTIDVHENSKTPQLQKVNDKNMEYESSSPQKN